ncbi:hypothetical protein Sjap_000462 [Stephania japonica]|uniref:RRM domain-containing protein n=1 Tax=Stephania japonica TaxID=461633 RepID=A0AAP0KI39_9MAGN
MDPALKKRKSDENGTVVAAAAAAADAAPQTSLTREDARRILEPLAQDQLLEILKDALIRHLDVLEAVRSVADRDPAQRKLFIRGLGWDTTTEGLRNLFSSYGDLEEAVVIIDKVTGKSKGYGFITFKHIDGALLALKEPSKKIDGRMTVTQLAAAGMSGPASNVGGVGGVDVSMRKIYVGNVPHDMPADRLLAHFSSYGEIEEGPLGFDKQTGKSRGFALFVYKSAEAARASLVDPMKTIDGHQMVCKLATDGKKGKPGAPGGGQVQGAPGEMVPPQSVPSQYGGGHGGPGAAGGLPSYGGYNAGPQGPGGLAHQNPNQPAIAGGGSYGGAGGGYGAYGGLSGGPGASGGYGGSSLYRLPPGSGGMPSGGYPESGHYGLSSSFPGQHHQPSGTSPVPRVPPGGMYQGMPPYY